MITVVILLSPLWLESARPKRLDRPYMSTATRTRKAAVAAPRSGTGVPAQRVPRVTEPTFAVTGAELEPLPQEQPPSPEDAAAEVWGLVQRVQKGYTEAFAPIYERYVDTVFRFVYFRVGNRQLAEDLTSDTFTKALKAIHRFTWQGRDLGAWLITIARNLVADHFKSGRHRLEMSTADILDADREAGGPAGAPERTVIDNMTNAVLVKALRQLNPDQQECLILRFLNEFSVAETAEAMGRNVNAVKALQYRAIRSLARYMPEGYHPNQ